ncbi:uncharacterized protein LOC129883046 [Solanum dulcamara]|uniref:uncharacterized protein LOC129883046 n=1 Tax=Solanum dulcamara TaxID=45834 RepID=UPI002485DF10|nr:uncharacterized protein LOC129883046 [Solanum dulcamara]
MSRCFPFPPPGYEKKPRPEDGDLLKEEKRKEKKHKKEKDKDKKDGKERRDKDRSDGKHREKKDKKDKHRDKKEKHKDKKKDKDKDKDKERSDLSEEAKVAVLPGASSGQKLPRGDQHKNESINSQEAKFHDQSHVQHAEKLFESSLPAVETEESKYVQDLARRFRDDQKGAVSQLAERFPVESKRDEKTNSMYIKNSGNLANEKEKNKERSVYSNKMDGQQVRVEPRIGANAILPSFPEMEERKFHGLLPPLEENVENRRDEKEKSKERRDDKPRDKKKKKEKDSKSHGKDKEKKKEEKGKEKSAHKKSEKDKSKDISKSNFVGVSNTNHQVAVVLKDTIAGVTEGNHRKRKDIETNGFLHENEVRPAKLLRPSSSHQPTPNGKRLEIHQKADMLSSNKQGVVTNIQMINKEQSLNGTMKLSNKHGVTTDIEMGNMETHQKTDLLSSHKQGVATNIQLINKDQSLNGTVRLSNKHGVATDIEMGNTETHQKTDMLSSDKQGGATDIQVINKEQSLNGTIKLFNKHRVATDIEMGNKVRGVNGTIKSPNKHGVATDFEVGNKERGVNGTIKGQTLTMSKPKTMALFKPKTSSMSPGADHIAETSKRPPHPDSKYLNQILSVPKMDEWSGFDDQEWLFGSKSTLVRKPDVCLDEVKDHRVWSEALRIESADVYALPYVIPY